MATTTWVIQFRDNGEIHSRGYDSAIDAAMVAANLERRTRHVTAEEADAYATDLRRLLADGRSQAEALDEARRLSDRRPHVTGPAVPADDYDAPH